MIILIKKILPEPIIQFLRNIRAISLPRNLMLLNIKIETLYFFERLLNPVSYNKSGMTYQAYQAISSGLKRSRKDAQGNIETVEKRYENYRLSNIIHPSMRALDIGANSCFLSIHLAQRTRSVVAIEPNPYLIKVGKITAKYMRVSNVEFFDMTLTKYFYTHLQDQFDLILSLAAFHTGDGRERTAAKEYMRKINHMLSLNGYFLFESVKLDSKKYDNRTIETKTFIEEIENSLDVIQNHEIDYGNNKYRYVILARR